MNEPLVVHRFRSGIGDAVNGYLLETPEAVVAVDSALGRTSAARLRAAVDALGKPLVGALITHGHPDHVSGLPALTRDTGATVVAGRAVATSLPDLYETGRRRFAAILGDEWEPTLIEPDTVVDDGEALTLGSVTVTLRDIGAGGDATSNSLWTVGGERSHVFIGDLAYNDVHAAALDGGVLAWLANLRRMRSSLAADALLYPGHGAPAGVELLALQEEYLLDCCAQVKERLGDDGALSPGARQEVIDHMTSAHPTAGLDMFIGPSADAIARELSLATAFAGEDNVL